MKILLLTSVFKDEELKSKDKSTNIVNSFAASFVKLGHEVIVIHNAHRYPLLLHVLPSKVKQFIASKIGFAIPDIEAVSKKEYEFSGAKVYRLPINKLIPHSSPSKSQISKQIKLVNNVLEENNFKPDVIIGHWPSPQLEIMSEIVPKFNCKSAIVLHGMEYLNNPKFPIKEYLTHVDKVGCRSVSQAHQKQELLKLSELPFVCYSGIPDEYLANFNLNTDKFNNINKWKFVYVGRLVEYKRIDVVIKSLANLKNVNWEFSIVGEGGELSNLQNLCKELNVLDKVKFLGRQPREKVMNILNESHCFVMVSKDEVFGLVYLEAMAASCLAIGSIGEGIDGIINDGENGFLVTPADIGALTKSLNNVCSMDKNDIVKIVENGYQTVQRFSDTEAAKDYLSKVTK